MIAREIERWLRLHSRRSGKPLGVVLHTSCLNYDTEQVRQIAQMGCRLVLPDNVFWELELLKGSKTAYGTKARKLLELNEKVCRVGWDLEQLYLPNLGGLIRSDLYDGTMVFLFGDLNKQDEFLKQVCPMERCHILLHADWEMEDRPVICSLNSVRDCSYREAVGLSKSVDVSPLFKLTEIRCYCGGSSRTISGRDFVKTGMYGSYSRIYTHNAYPGRYFKIYKEKAQTDTSAQKLRELMQYVRKKPIAFAAFPEALLVTENNMIVGYGVPIRHGRPLREYCERRWNGKSPEQIAAIIKELLLELLELHLHGILVNDLSNNNILVSGNDTVHFVDCDSMQFKSYPGGAITELYRHPQISRGTELRELRQPRHEYFALAVLLFQCYVSGDPLYGENANWTNSKFEFGENLYDGANVNEDLWENWKGLTDVLRRMFSDVFLLRRDYSIGAWYRGLSEQE